MFEIREVYSKDELNIFGNMKLELMNYHVKYAERFGIVDNKLIHYSYGQAIAKVNQRINYLIFWNNKPAGMSQVQEQISEIDLTPILFVHSLYIKPFAQNHGIGGYYLRYLCEKYNKRIEAECWYEIPAKTLYQRAGFQPLMTRYMLPINNRYYGEDQN